MVIALMLVKSLPRWPNYQRRSAQTGEVGGGTPSRGTNLAHVVQGRDGALKTRKVPVQTRPWAPSACSPISRGARLKPGRLQVQIPPRGPFWNANRTSEPGLGANECVPPGMWRKPTAFRHS